MTKDKMLTVLVEAEFQERVKAQSEKMGVRYSEVVRRALEAWLITGEMPIVPTESKPTKAKGVKRSKTKK
jgi:antitoxin component of RelBE/YafQ-DinJ toxin-antitoxin module